MPLPFKPIPFNHISDDVIKDIAGEIMREYKIKTGLELNPDHVSYAVCLLSLNPKFELSQQSQFNRKRVQKFVDNGVEMFSSNPRNIVIQIFQMQVEFIQQTTDLRDIQIKYDAITDTKLEKIYKEMIEYLPETDVDFEDLLKKFCTIIICKNKLGDPSNPEVFEQSMYALKSVISRQDLVEYVEMKKRHRENYFSNLNLLVCGIRIFNKKNGQCDEGIRDIVDDLKLALKNTRQSLNESLKKAREFIKIGAKTLNFAVGVNLKTSLVEIILPTICLKDELYEFNKHLLLFYQYEYFLIKLMNLLKNTRSNLEFHFEHFHKVLLQLHEIVQFRIAVPTDMVYPFFTELANIWNNLLIHLYLMVEINALNDKITKLVDFSYLRTGLELLEIGKQLKPYISSYTNQKPKDLNHQLKPINPETVQPFEKFGAYIFVETNGLLVESDERVGVMQYNNINYGFQNRGLANFFEEDIKQSEIQLMKVLHSNPEFIYFFQMLVNVYNFNLHSPQRYTEKVEAVSKKMVSMECQTETHPIPSLIDKHYFWNVWDLRREAIKLTNLKNCLTTSSQTNVLHQRRNHSIQTEVSRFYKSIDIQTNNDKKNETE